jgi:hypothetical protein
VEKKRSNVITVQMIIRRGNEEIKIKNDAYTKLYIRNMQKIS